MVNKINVSRLYGFQKNYKVRPETYYVAQMQKLQVFELQTVGTRLEQILLWKVNQRFRWHYTKSNPIDDHCNISSKKLQKQNFKPLGHYTCMQCGTSHLQKLRNTLPVHLEL